MPDYQIVVNLCVYVMAIAFPIALVFMISQKIIAIFVGVMFGKDIYF